MTDQSTFDSIVARNWRTSGVSPDQAAANAQRQADAYTNEQLAIQQEQPASWPAQQAAQARQQQLAADAARKTDAALRARQQATNFQQTSSAKAPPAQPPSVQQAIAQFYGKGKKGGKS